MYKLEFFTRIKDSLTVNIKKIFPIDMTYIDIWQNIATYVKWDFEVLYDQNHIRSLIAKATHVSVVINWKIQKEGLSQEEIIKLEKFSGYYCVDTIEGIIRIDSLEKFNENQWTVKSEIKITENGVLPYECEIDFTNNLITIK